MCEPTSLGVTRVVRKLIFKGGTDKFKVRILQWRVMSGKEGSDTQEKDIMRK